MKTIREEAEELLKEMPNLLKALIIIDLIDNRDNPEIEL